MLLLDFQIRVRDLLRRRLLKKSADHGSPDEQFFFIHIHKTAGTSFRYMLYKQFEQTEIFPNLTDIHEFGGRYPRYPELLQADPSIFSRIRLLTGHYPFEVVKFFPRRPRCLVFLRDPLKRALSNLYHLRRYAYPAGTDMTAILPRAKNGIFNVQTRFFAVPYHREPLSRADLEVAKGNLAQCDFIGLREEFEVSVRLAERMFDWRLGKTFELNVTRLDEPALDNGLLAQLELGNAFDFEFYEHGKALFRELKRRYGMA